MRNNLSIKDKNYQITNIKRIISMNTENHLKTASSKEPYTAPAIEIIPLENSEPVMQGSFSVPGYGDGSMFPSSSARNRGRNASTSELEDLINDILTIEN